MENHDVATFLSRLGQLLEISGANPFKVRAFAMAADAVDAHYEPVEAMARDGRLTDIEGVGTSIAGDIQAYLERGTCPLWDALTATVPPSVLDLLKVRGLGPRKAAALWGELGIRDLTGLRAAATSGGLGQLRGFGAKTTQNILDELERIERMAERTPLGIARREADRLRDYLAKVPGTIDVTVTGSCRRWAETVHDLDMVACTDGDPMPLMNALTRYSETEAVLAHGPSKTAVRLRGGLACDLLVVKPEVWGAAIHHFTGSKAHHIGLRSRARERGLTISEHGVRRADDGTLVAGRNEADIYEVLGLPYVPPELREGRGELDAAEAGTLPRLLELRDVRGDLHMHTVASDGLATAEEMARAARALGYEYVCIADHSQATLVTGGLSADRMPEYIAGIRRADAAVDGIRVLAGIEVDILRDGTLDLPDAWLDQLDFVVASVHSGFRMESGAMTERLVRAIRSGRVHALGHPTGRRLGERDPYAFDFDAVVAAALDHGVAFEINANPIRLDLNDVLARRAIEAGVPLIVSSDAHSVRGLEVMPYGIAQARRGWAEPGDVLNALPWADFAARVGLDP